MKRTVSGLLLAFVAILLCPAPSFCSERADLFMTKAIHAMNTGDDARAFSYLEKVLEIEPQNVRAIHLQGVAATRLGRFRMAETILKRCIAFSNAPADAHFALGYVLYSQGKYREAVVQFDIARRQGVEETSIYYYIGAALFRLGEYRQAITYLDPIVDELPTVQENTNFYLGASHYALGNYLRAQKYLRRAMELAPGTDLAQRAATLYEASARDRKKTKWWDVTFEMGSGWDSNVLYEPEDFEVSDQDAALFFVDFSGSLTPILKQQGSVKVGYDFYQSFHYDRQSDATSDFDLQTHTPMVSGYAKLFGTEYALYTGMEYRFLYALLGGDKYQVSHEFYPNITMTQTAFTATRFAVAVEKKEFREFDERDGFFYEPQIGQLFHFLQGRGKGVFEVGYQQNTAESKLYDFDGWRVSGASIVPIYNELYSLAMLQAIYLEYPNHPEERIDRKYSVNIGLEYRFATFFAAQARYRWVRNVSLDRYTWQKHVPTVSLLMYF